MDMDPILERFCKRLVALDMDIFGLRKQPEKVVEDDRWITVHPGGKGMKADGSGMKGGTPVLLNDEGEVIGGMGGKFKGTHIAEVRKSFEGPIPSPFHRSEYKKAQAEGGEAERQYAQKQSYVKRLKAIRGEQSKIYEQQLQKINEYNAKSWEICDEIKEKAITLSNDEISAISSKQMEESFDNLPSAITRRLGVILPRGISDKERAAIVQLMKEKNFIDKIDDYKRSVSEVDALNDKRFELSAEKNKTQDLINDMPVFSKPNATVINSAQNRERINKTFTKVKNKQSKEEMAEAFSDAEDRLVSAFENYCEDMKVKRVKNGGSCSLDGINIVANIEKSNRERRIDLCELNGHLGTIRHEMGHYLDQQNGWISSSDQDFNEAINNFNITPKNIQDLSSNGKYYYNAAMSDIFAALTYGQHEGAFGHTKRYWKKDGNRQTEIFANLTDAYAAKDKRYWKEMQEEFPELTKAYLKIIDKLS
jgi:hypothetical protein